MQRRFSYEGDHAEVTLYGVTFPQGQPVAVEDETLLKKLAGNSHFREHDAYLPTEALPAELPVKRKPGRPRKDS